MKCNTQGYSVVSCKRVTLGTAINIFTRKSNCFVLISRRVEWHESQEGFVDATLANGLIRFMSAWHRADVTIRRGWRSLHAYITCSVIVMPGRHLRDVAYQNTYFRRSQFHGNEISTLQTLCQPLEAMPTSFRCCAYATVTLKPTKQLLQLWLITKSNNLFCYCWLRSKVPPAVASFRRDILCYRLLLSSARHKW